MNTVREMDARAGRHLVVPSSKGMSLCVLIVATMSACGGDSLLSSTPPGSPTPLSLPNRSNAGLSTRTITGSVLLYSGAGTRETVANVVLETWVERPGVMYFAGYITGDSAGRFSFEVPSDGLVRLYAHPPGLYQPCLTTVKAGQTETTLRLVSEADVVRAREWPDFKVETLLSGTIFETSAMGRLPLPDARVQVDGVTGDGRPLSDTLTDADGRFVVCGLEGSPLHALVAFKTGYQWATTMIPTQGAGPIDLELKR